MKNNTNHLQLRTMKLHKKFFFVVSLNPLPDNKFYSSELKDFADDNFKFDKNGRKLSKPVENTVGKGEIAHSVFKRLVSQGRQKASLCGNGLKGYIAS